MREPIEKYIDIINLPHHISKKHPQMPRYDRAAQFAPFAALTGYEEVIEEEGRQTNDRIEINDEAKYILDMKMQILMKNIKEMPFVSITYFIPDEKKSGGEYVTLDTKIKKIDIQKQVLITEDGINILANEIVDIQGDIFKNLELDY
ncbi:MAG: hypothetical protein IJH12_10260 [Clostridia bacterium]|nr:hypothetical protein [Clostridia bacterium]